MPLPDAYSTTTSGHLFCEKTVFFEIKVAATVSRRCDGRMHQSIAALTPDFSLVGANNTEAKIKQKKGH
jgi:hypothetical protein